MSELMEALQERTGLEPTLVEHEVSYESGYENGRMNAWRELGSTIDAMGPCILSKMGHVVMLDNVREAGGQIYLSIRDPFHGTSLECVESSEFFRTPMGPVEDATVRAIFLGKPGA